MIFDVIKYLEEQIQRDEAERDERIAWEEENYLYNPNEDAGDRD